MREEEAMESRSLRESGTAWKNRRPSYELLYDSSATQDLIRDIIFSKERVFVMNSRPAHAAEEWTCVPWITWFSLIDIYPAMQNRLPLNFIYMSILISSEAVQYINAMKIHITQRSMAT